MPKVSVIIPVYNAEKYIKRTIQSVLDQTYTDYEIIVVDDGSTDYSKEVLSSYGDKVRYFYQKNSGVSAARNRAIREAKGEYIALLDQDDLWYSQRLEKQIALLDKRPDTGIVYADCNYIDAEDKVLLRLFEKGRSYSGKVFEQLAIDNFIPIPTVLIKKEILDKTGLFLEDYTFAEEYDLFLRIARNHNVEFIDEVLAGYRIHDTNLSKDIENSLKEDIKVTEHIMDKYPDDIENISGRLKKKLAELYYRLGRVCMQKKNKVQARDYLAKSIKASSYSYKQYIFYILSLV
ncbi:MAG: glycosyltransferase [Armatimonadota bacterium]